MIARRIVLFIGLTLSSLAAPSQGAASLSSDQVAVLTNRNSAESLEVARHYMARRSVPADHLIQLDLPTDETITRQQYEDQVLRPVRQALINRKLASKIRVLVTTYGVPLSIGPQTPSPSEERWLKDAEERRRFAEANLERALEWMARIAPSNGGPDEKKKQSESAASTPLVPRLDEATRSALRRMKDVKDPKQIEQWNGELAKVMKVVGGTAALVQNLSPAPSSERDKAETQLVQLKQQVGSARQALQTLMTQPTNETRDHAYKLSERVFGLLGVLRLAMEESAAYAQKESDASFDSELSLLWWDSDFYRLTGRINNPLYYATRGFGRPPATTIPMVMVSRLDGPSAAQTAKLVDQAIAAEVDGLQGKVYVDAKGMKPDPSSAYAQYDQSLRDFAALVKSKTRYDVILEDTERRFSNPGEASDTALYAGWYKLRSYEDAFTFRTGAIGYHLASGEAISLRDPVEPGWCKNALEHGIAATMGSTGEPYLDSFPFPQEFFGLLLTGRFSLVEAYYVTSRYASWRMVLVGDPLYNPWRKKEQVSVSAVSFLPGPNGQITPPVPPSEQEFPDPVEAGRAFRQQRQTLIADIERQIAEAEKQEQQRKKGK